MAAEIRNTPVKKQSLYPESWEDRFDFEFPQGALDDMQRAYMRDIKSFISTQLERLINDIPDNVYVEYKVTRSMKTLKQGLKSKWLQ